MKRPSFRKRDRLRQIEVLIADPDPRISRLVKSVLESFGFRNIHVTKNGADAIEILRHRSIDLVITEWPMEPLDGMSFVHFVRHSTDLANRDIPIIMLTGRAETVDVEKARDSGVTEFVVKPFTAATLSNRLIQVIDNPRSFIICKQFIGPDRRRRENNAVDKDKRMSPEELAKHTTRRGNKLIHHIYDQEVIIENPDRSLKQMLGADLTAEELFDEQVVGEAQEAITHMAHDFSNWVMVDINRLEHAYNALKEEPDNKLYLKEIASIALTVKSQSGTFGYDLATEVGKLLYQYADELAQVNDVHLTVIRKHIDTLYVIFHQQTLGNGAALGDELIVSLKKLIEKSYRGTAV